MGEVALLSILNNYNAFGKKGRWSLEARGLGWGSSVSSWGWGGS